MSNELGVLPARDVHAEHRNRLLRALSFVGLVAVLAGAVPLWLLAEIPDVGRSAAWPLTTLLIVWSGIRMTMIIVVGRPMLFDFFFWLFSYIFMGIAPTVQIRSGLISTTTPGMDSTLDVPTALIVCLGVLCYEIGRLLALWRELHLKAPGTGSVPSPGTVNWPGVGTVRTFVLLILGVAASAYFVSKVGVGSLFTDRYNFFRIRSIVWPDTATRSVMTALAVYPLLVGIGGLAQLRRVAGKATARWYLVIMIVAVLLLLVVVNPISSARYTIGTVLFALAVYLGVVVNKWWTRITLMGTIFAFIFLFPIADAFRGLVVNASRNGFFGEYKSNPDYDAFWQIANAHSYVLDGLVHFGEQGLGVLLFWVPRSLWPAKPVDTGILLANFRGYGFGNLSAPLWAEFLVNGGIAFLIVGFIVIGFLLRRLDTKLLPAFTHVGFWAIVGAIFPVYMTILLRGSLLQATGSLVVVAGCLLLVHKRPPRAAVDAAADQPVSLPELGPTPPAPNDSQNRAVVPVGSERGSHSDG